MTAPTSTNHTVTVLKTRIYLNFQHESCPPTYTSEWREWRTCLSLPEAPQADVPDNNPLPNTYSW